MSNLWKVLRMIVKDYKILINTKQLQKISVMVLECMWTIYKKNLKYIIRL